MASSFDGIDNNGTNSNTGNGTGNGTTGTRTNTNTGNGTGNGTTGTRTNTNSTNSTNTGTGIQSDLNNPNGGVVVPPAPLSKSGTPGVIPIGFCGSEDQISDHTCNSLHPAVSIDHYGSAGVAWHDTRNGTFDIYFKTIFNPLPKADVLLGIDATIDPKTGRKVNLACSGFSAYSLLGASCDISAGTGVNFIARHSGGILDINATSRIAVLSGTHGENFITEGIRPGSRIKIENGANAGAIFTVSGAVADSVLELVYYDGPVSDSGFIYTLQSNPPATATCETRLTCGVLTSTYPDVITDSQGRYHIVYQAGTNGKDDLYYVQIFPSSVGELKCANLRILTIGTGDDIPSNPGTISQVLTGTPTKTFFFGLSTVPDPLADRKAILSERTGFHRLFKNFQGVGKWTGVSDVEDIVLWRDQTMALGAPLTTPPFMGSSINPLLKDGDFGSEFDFKNISFLAESSSSGKTTITKIVLPLKPKCTPSNIPYISAVREQDLIVAPKTPIPPTFYEPIDLSSLQTITDQMPNFFTIDGDTNIYTNLLITGAGGLSRLIFKKDIDVSKEIKFILGQRLCGTENCAVTVPTDNSNLNQKQAKYKVKLQVWQGPATSSADISSASLPATLLFDDDFYFGPGDDRRTFLIKEGRLVADQGKYLFFVAIADDDNSYFIDAVGHGSTIWSTDGSGRFDQYYSPYTVPPNAGLFASVYYEAFVTPPVIDHRAPVSCDKPIDGKFKVIGSTLVADSDFKLLGSLGVASNTSNTGSYHYLTQKFKLCRDAVVESMICPVRLSADNIESLEASIVSTDGQTVFQDSNTAIPIGVPGIVDITFKSAIATTVLPKGEYLFRIRANTHNEAARSSINIPISSKTTPNSDGILNMTSLEGSLSLSSAAGTDVPGTLSFVINFGIAPVIPNGTGGSAGIGIGENTGGAFDTEYVISPTIKLTNQGGKHPRMAKDAYDNIWLVFFSDRTGNDEVYITKFFADCGQWASSTQGGNELRLSNAGANGKTANFPNCSVDGKGEVHIVWQSTDTEDEHSEIFYASSSGGGNTFRLPIRLTTSPKDALMPDITIADDPSGNEKEFVFWHDSRFGQFQIMAAMKENGLWISSGQGKSDIRITNTGLNAMFPRAYSDTKANVRVAWHDYRRGVNNPGIYMGTYVGAAQEWESSGQGGTDILITPTGTRSSLFPDIAIDPVNGVFIVWQDDRLALTNPDQHEEIFGSYCARQDAALVHYAPIRQVNVEGIVISDVTVINCITGEEVIYTNSVDVCLKINAPGATFYRIANENGTYNNWQPFSPNGSFDTTIVPCKLTSGNGVKNISVQVQTDKVVGFPIIKTVILQSLSPSYQIRLFYDKQFTLPLPFKESSQVSSFGDVYFQMQTDIPLKELPTFDVISRGRKISNQTMSLPTFIFGVSGYTGDAVDPFIGATDFIGSFELFVEDGVFNIDGMARIIPHGIDIYGNRF